MTDGILWCPHCGGPHLLADVYCRATGKALSRTVHQRRGAPAVEPSLVGSVIDGKYHVVKRLGGGGMGEVFEAEHRTLAKRVAIKIVSKATGDAVERLRREALVIASIDHPNICQLYDVGTMPDGNPYLVLERLTGETLEQRLRRKRMTPREAVEAFSQVLSGIHVAHSAGIVHRDLKPANIFLVERVGCAPLLKVFDFGLAKDTSGRRFNGRMTQAGRSCGTPSYMSPEQLLASEIDHRADLFSVGLMLFEAIMGRHPFAASTVAGVGMNILEQPCPRMRGPRSSVPEALEHVVMRALEKSRALRFESAQAMQSALIASVRPRSEETSVLGSDTVPSLPRLLYAESSGGTDTAPSLPRLYDESTSSATGPSRSTRRPPRSRS